MQFFIPGYCFEDSFVENVQSALIKMGHEVRTLGNVEHKKYWSLPRYASRVAIQMMRGDQPTKHDYKILKVAREFKPDVVLSTSGTIHPTILNELGKIASGRRVLWWGDPPANSQKWGVLAPGWDVVYIKDRVAAEKLRLVGRRAYLLHEAMNPLWHRPVAGRANHAVVVAGNYYAFRQAIILRLINDGVSFQLFGSKPPRWADPQINKHHTGRYIVKDEKSKIFGEGMACLNTFSLAEGNSLNCRAFEIAGAGGLQLIEYRSAIEECFDIDKEVIAFKCYEELLDGIRRAEKYPQEMSAIRQAGARRAMSEHTYEHRLNVILKNL
jgi:spore maturation protein CgeB